MTGPGGHGSIPNQGAAAAVTSLLHALGQLVTFYGPPTELEKLGPWTGQHFELPSPVKGDVILVNWSRQERD